jgi:hypothetical protein
MITKDPDRDRHHSIELGLTKQALLAILEEVATARGLTTHDVIHGGKTEAMVSARRAICVVASDLFMLSYKGYSPMSWTYLSEFFSQARSTLYHSTEKWVEQEGSQNGKKESHLRASGSLLPAKETIHEMAQRVCKRRMRSVPKGVRKKLGYFCPQGGVNHG